MARSATQLIGCLRDVFREHGDTGFDAILLGELDEIIRTKLSLIDLDQFFPSFTLTHDQQEAFCNDVLISFQSKVQGEQLAYLSGIIRGLKLTSPSLSSSLASLRVSTPSPTTTGLRSMSWADEVERVNPIQPSQSLVSRVTSDRNQDLGRQAAKRPRVETAFNAARAHGVAIASAKGISYPYIHCSRSSKQCYICRQANAVIPVTPCTTICTAKHGGKWAHWSRKSLNSMHKLLPGSTNLHNCVTSQLARLFTATHFANGTVPQAVLNVLGKATSRPVAKATTSYSPVSPAPPSVFEAVVVSDQVLESLPPLAPEVAPSGSSVASSSPIPTREELLHGLGSVNTRLRSKQQQQSTAMDT